MLKSNQIVFKTQLLNLNLHLALGYRAHLFAAASCKALCQAAAHAAAGRDPPSSAASRLRKFPQWLCLRSPLLPTTFPERIPRQ